MTSTDYPPFGVQIDDRLPPCRTCDKPILLAVRLPPGWPTTTGGRAFGDRQVALCATCSAGQPGAGGLLTFFAVNGEHVGDEEWHEFARLLSIWVQNIKVREVTDADLEDDLRAWRRGEFD